MSKTTEAVRQSPKRQKAQDQRYTLNRLSLVGVGRRCHRGGIGVHRERFDSNYRREGHYIAFVLRPYVTRYAYASAKSTGF